MEAAASFPLPASLGFHKAHVVIGYKCTYQFYICFHSGLVNAPQTPAEAGKGRPCPARSFPRSSQNKATSELFFHNLNQHSSPANWISVKPCDLCANPRGRSPCAKLPKGCAGGRWARGAGACPAAGRSAGIAPLGAGHCTHGCWALQPHIWPLQPTGHGH